MKRSEKKRPSESCVCVCVCFVAQYFVLHETVIVFSLYTKERTNDDERSSIKSKEYEEKIALLCFGVAGCKRERQG